MARDGGGGRGNVLHHVKGRANCPGEGNVLGNMSGPGDMSRGKYIKKIVFRVPKITRTAKTLYEIKGVI